MALINADRVLETSTTTGTGAFDLLGAVTGFQAFSAVCATSDTCYYSIYAVNASGVPSGEWETGLGTYSAASQLTRTTPAESSNAGAEVNFSAGTKYVMIGPIASGGTSLSALTGDVTATGPGTAAATIANNAVSNAKLADMATASFKGRTTAGTGDPEDLTATQATAMLNAFTDALKGLVPASGGGTSNYLRADGTWTAPAGGGGGDMLAANNLSDVANAATAGANIRPVESIVIACSDETTAITTGTAKVTFRMPYAFTLTAVRASVTTAPTGSTILIDINEGGTTILSTKLMIDASEKTSTTAATPAVISDSSLADDAEITIDFDQVGSTIAGAGVKVYLIGHRT